MAPAEVAVSDPVEVELTGRDIEDSEFDLLVEVITPPTRGELDQASGAAELHVTYTPIPGLFGFDAFSFVVIDLDGAASAPATVLLFVEDPDAAAPVPVADALVTVPEDGLVSFDLDGEDEGSITISVVSAPDAGVLGPPTGLAPLEVAYVPDSDFHGFDAFTFTASDTDGHTSREARVLLQVTPVNDAPVATDDSEATDLSTPILVDVLANDTDIDGDRLEVTITTPPAQGTATVEVDGTVLYVPAATGDHDIGYTITDPDGLSDSAVLTVAVGS